MKIIVIDDEKAALSTFLYGILNKNDVFYKMFTDPFLALDFVDKNIIGAFLDVNMPLINGVDLAEKLIEKNPNIKIVFTTGYIQHEKMVIARLGANLLGFCYKPYDNDRLIEFLRLMDTSSTTNKICIKTFGGFDVYLNGIAVNINATKVKELLALLVEKRGGTVAMGDAIACLWGDKDVDLAKRSYRDAVYRLRNVLVANGIESLVEFGRAFLRIKTDGVICDLWETLDDPKSQAAALYAGNYLQNYSWSMDMQSSIENLLDYYPIDC